MQIKRVIGIDFGTSTTVVRVKRYEEEGEPIGDRLYTANLLFDGKDYVPTLIQIPEDETIKPELELSEEDCEFGHYAAVEQPGMRTYRNFKVELESDDENKRIQARWLTEHFFQYIGQEYQDQKNQLGSSLDEEVTYVSYPAKYGEDTRSFMISVAQKAGFQNVKGITEPEAAVRAVVVQDEEELNNIGFFNRTKPIYILMIDMGAGTTDLAVCNYLNGETQIVSTWPDKNTDIYFGGKEVDELLCRYIEDYLRQNNSTVPDYFIDSFSEKYMDTIKTWKETTVSRSLKRGRNVPSFQYIKNIYPNLPDFNPAIDKEELERNCSDYLKRFSELITGCMEYTKKKDPKFGGGESIELVVLTGGHSQWYFIEDMLQGKKTEFGVVGLQQIQENAERIRKNGKPQETVAVGMTYLLQKRTTKFSKGERIENETLSIPNRMEEIVTDDNEKQQLQWHKETNITPRKQPKLILECSFQRSALSTGGYLLSEGICKFYGNRLCLEGKNKNIEIYIKDIMKYQKMLGARITSGETVSLLIPGVNIVTMGRLAVQGRMANQFSRATIYIKTIINEHYNIAFNNKEDADRAFEFLEKRVKKWS